MLLGAVHAQEVGSSADPAGLAHGSELLKTFQANQSDPHNAVFLEQFQEDPNLSKRAFVSMVEAMVKEYDATPEVAQVHGMFALTLAQLIDDKFGDPAPLKIFEGLTKSEESAVIEMVTYLSQLLEAAGQDGEAVASSFMNSLESASSGGGTEEDKEYEGYGEDPSRASDLPAEAFEALRPFLIKIMRIQYAIAVANSDLIVSELDSYPESVSALDAAVQKMGLEAGITNELMTPEILRLLALEKLTVMAEIGLLKEFEESSKTLLAGGVDPLTEAAISLSGYRASFRQNRADEAEKYLRRARTLLNDPATPTDPVLEYSLRTAEYQLRRLKGFEPSAAQVVQESQKAWAALDGYDPLKIIRHENNWYYGRLATRFWMDELAPYPEQASAQSLVILGRTIQWANSLSTFGDFAKKYSEDDLLMRNEEVFGFCVFALSITDQMTYVLESSPEILKSTGGVEEIVGQLEELTDIFATLPEEMGLGITGPGFPPYNISSGGLLPELKARFRYLEALGGNGSIAQKSGKLSQAIELIRTTKNPEVTVDYLIKTGREFAKLQQFDAAVSAWQDAYKLANDLNFVHRGIEASTLLAQEYGRRGDWQKAAFYADGASDKIQDTAPLLGLRSPEGKEMAARSEHLTGLSVKAHIESDDPEKALAALTRNQQVQSAAVQMEGQKEAQKEARQVLKAEDQVAALGQEVDRLQSMPASTIRNDLLTKTQDLLASTKTEFLLESRGIRQKYSDLYSRVLKFDPLNLPDVQKTLPEDLAVIQYFATEDALYIFLVTRDTFRLHSVAVSDKNLNISVSAFRRAVAKRVNGDPKLAQNSRQLYDWLVKPVTDDIKDKSTLILIPSGRLHGLPFACLTDAQGEPLIASKRILELAKPTDLMRVSSEKVVPVASVVAFANATGDLPAAAREGEQIAALFPDSQLFEGKEATRENFFKHGGDGEVLHLATHGELNLDDSLENYLAMAGSERVAQEEIFALGLDKTSIVILSACNTAMGEGTDAKYVASLAEAFWIAGSRSVVASLWDVNDASTAVLMTEFYGKLRAGMGKAEALQAAQMAVRSRDEYAHPYYWAGFLLFGDWR